MNPYSPDWLSTDPRPDAFRFCGADHHHITVEDAANCPELDFAFGPLHPIRVTRGRKRFTVSGCQHSKVYESAYCSVHRRQNIARNKARRGSW